MSSTVFFSDLTLGQAARETKLNGAFVTYHDDRRPGHYDILDKRTAEAL